MTITQAIKVADTAIPSADELVLRAQALIPILRAQAAQIEEARVVPPEVITAFHDAGFFRILQPKRWGGYEMNPFVFYRVLMELGRGCPSSAWNMMVLGIHQFLFGLLDPRVGDELWGEDQRVLVASSLAPFGAARKVDGGWILSGSWKTSSGCDHAEGGTLLGARVTDAEGRMIDHRIFLVNKSDYTHFDDWNVVGLAGTGSKTVVVGEAFVPDYRSTSIIAYEGTENPSYSFPFNLVFNASISAVDIGIARGMIDIYIEQMGTRENVLRGGNAAANPYVKDKLGNAVLLVRQARARMLQAVQEATAHVEAGRLVPLEDRVQHAIEISRVGRDCLDATTMLWKKLSARAIWLENPAQLWMRAMLVGGNHSTQNEDDPAGVLGGFLLGQGVPPLAFGLPEQKA